MGLKLTPFVDTTRERALAAMSRLSADWRAEADAVVAEDLRLVDDPFMRLARNQDERPSGKKR